MFETVTIIRCYACGDIHADDYPDESAAAEGAERCGWFPDERERWYCRECWQANEVECRRRAS